MIHSARPAVSLVVNIAFCCFVFIRFEKCGRTDIRTDGQHVRKQWSLPAEWIKKTVIGNFWIFGTFASISGILSDFLIRKIDLKKKILENKKKTCWLFHPKLLGIRAEGQMRAIFGHSNRTIKSLLLGDFSNAFFVQSCQTFNMALAITAFELVVLFNFFIKPFLPIILMLTRSVLYWILI